MISVLISIRPRWCELIASGQKTIEDGLFEKVAITFYGSCKAEISTTSKGFIRIKRSETKTGQTEI